jgi:hypothetical protein
MGGLIIDVIGKGKGDESDEDEDLAEEESAEMPTGDPESLIAGSESQLAELRALVAGL